MLEAFCNAAKIRRLRSAHWKVNQICEIWINKSSTSGLRDRSIVLISDCHSLSVWEEIIKKLPSSYDRWFRFSRFPVCDEHFSNAFNLPLLKWKRLSHFCHCCNQITWCPCKTADPIPFQLSLPSRKCRLKAKDAASPSGRDIWGQIINNFPVSYWSQFWTYNWRISRERSTT
jgi:hypothetical protein